MLAAAGLTPPPLLLCAGANMPSTAEAIAVYLRAGVVYGPAKAANAGQRARTALVAAPPRIFHSDSASDQGRLLFDVLSVHVPACDIREPQHLQ